MHASRSVLFLFLCNGFSSFFSFFALTASFAVGCIFVLCLSGDLLPIVVPDKNSLVERFFAEREEVETAEATSSFASSPVKYAFRQFCDVLPFSGPLLAIVRSLTVC